MRKGHVGATFPIFLLGMISGVIGFVSLVIVTRDTQMSATLGQMGPGDFSTLLAGFGGAIFGGIVSFALARKTAAEAAAAAEADRVAKEKALALSLFLKVQLITNGLNTQTLYIWDALNRANDHGRLGEPLWQFIQPQVGLDVETPMFQAEEFIPLLQGKRTELINDCQLLSLRYNVIEQSFKTYNQKREKIQDLIRPFSEVGPDGQILSKIPPIKKDSLAILIAEIETLITSLRKTLAEDYRFSIDLTWKLSSALNDYFGDDFIKLHPPEL